MNLPGMKRAKSEGLAGLFKMSWDGIIEEHTDASQSCRSETGPGTLNSFQDRTDPQLAPLPAAGLTRDVVTMYPTESNTARELDNGIPGAANAPSCSEFSEDNTMSPRNHSSSPAVGSGTGAVLSTEHDNSGPHTVFVILSDMMGTAASLLEHLCDDKDFPGTKLAIAYPFPDSSESLSDAALDIASSSAQLIKNYTENAKNVFLCGLGYGTRVVAELLKTISLRTTK